MTIFKAVDEWTQDSVWYNALPLFEKYKDILKRMPTRKHFKSLIRKACELLGVTREQIGIVAAPWATMYFNGSWDAVGFDRIESLAKNGTDIVFIEKLDIVKVLGKYADRYGVALVNSRGHLSEYAKTLAKLAEDDGAHIAILTDYDVPGVKIASELEDIEWLGVNENMIDYFGISKENKLLVVPYKPKKKRMKLEKLMELAEDDERFSDGIIDVEFIWDNKIELDAVLATVGSEQLWEYIANRLNEIYPTRNYNRVIDSSPPTEVYLPAAIKNLNIYINRRVKLITHKEGKKIKKELENVKGFINVNTKRAEIAKRQGKIIEDDQHIKDIASKIEELVKKEGYDISKIQVPADESEPESESKESMAETSFTSDTTDDEINDEEDDEEEIEDEDDDDGEEE